MTGVERRWSWLREWLPRKGKEPAREPAPVDVPEPVPEPAPVDVPGRDPGIDLSVATAVLTVAQRLTSAELRRRLVEAISALPDVTVVFPGSGEKFDAELHTWEDSVTPPTPEAEGTIAETRAAGLLDHQAAVRRRARVVVYETRGN